MGWTVRWGRYFPHLSRPVLGPTQTPLQWVLGLSRGQRAARAWCWPLTPFQCCGQEWVEQYLYSPYGPYSLYRASVPVQYSYTSTPPMGHTVCTELQCLYSTAITLLPLWAVRSVQSLSDCTRVHFNFTLQGIFNCYFYGNCRSCCI